MPPAGDHPAARCGEPPSPQLLHGIAQFNRREYFACHETLEDIWLADRGPIRTLYKGILQVGVGGLHLLRGNYRGATAKLRSGADYLVPYAPACMGVDVARLIADARTLLAELERFGPTRLGEVDLDLLPIVHMTDTAAGASNGRHAPT